MQQDVANAFPSFRRVLLPCSVRGRVVPLMGYLGFCLVLAGCGVWRTGASSDAVSPDRLTLEQATQTLLRTPDAGQAWLPFLLPGKSYAPFEPVFRQGRAALQVQALHSVSILRQRFDPPLPQVGTLVFSWKVDALPEGADLKEASSADAPVRILLAFDGDPARWTARTHRLSEMSRLLTGEPLPYATLSYVWSAVDPVGSVLTNPRTDRIRKLVVESGGGRLGQWLDYERNVRADFIQAFGEEPGPLLAVALMTDTDNTQSTLKAWYGALRLDARP